MTLKITFDDSYSGWNNLRVDLNGNTLDIQSYGSQLVCNNVPTMKGGNSLRLVWQNPNAKDKNPIRVEGIEFLVNHVNEE